MTDPRALLDVYAQVPNLNVIPLPFTPEHCAPLAFTALRSVLDLHRDRPMWDGTRNVPSGTCAECSEREDTYDDIPWPCLTVRAIANTLEAS